MNTERYDHRLVLHLRRVAQAHLGELDLRGVCIDLAQTNLGRRLARRISLGGSVNRNGATAPSVSKRLLVAAIRDARVASQCARRARTLLPCRCGSCGADIRVSGPPPGTTRAASHAFVIVCGFKLASSCAMAATSIAVPPPVPKPTSNISWVWFALAYAWAPLLPQRTRTWWSVERVDRSSRQQRCSDSPKPASSPVP